MTIRTLIKTSILTLALVAPLGACDGDDEGTASIYSSGRTGSSELLLVLPLLFLLSVYWRARSPSA